MKMMSQIFPNQFDNTYQGHDISKYALIPLTMIILFRSIIHLCYYDGGVESIAKINLEKADEELKIVVYLTFRLWGLAQLLLSLVYLMALCFYQSMIPFMYLTLILECGIRYLLFIPYPRRDFVPPGRKGSLPMFILTVTLFFFSINTLSSSNGHSSEEKEF